MLFEPPPLSLDPRRAPRAKPLVETLERIRLTTQTPDELWHDLVGLRHSDYLMVKAGVLTLRETALERVAGHFGYDEEAVLLGRLDFSELQIRFEPCDAKLPETYLRAAHGRRRSTINAIQFVESWAGWRLKLAALRKFDVPEAELRNPFAPISIQLMTELCEFLRQRGFLEFDFYRMGEYLFEASRGSLVAHLLAQSSTVAELYEFFFTQSIQLFEANCRYDLVVLTSTHAVVEALTNPSVGAELGVRHVGNEHICAFKRGMIAAVPRFIGRPPATVRETTCVHRGDRICRFEVDFTLPA